MQGPNFDPEKTEITNVDRNSVRIIDNTLYKHKVLRVQYTTYDVRRDQDSINPRNQPFVMVLAPPDKEADPDEDPHYYAQVLFPFHVNVTGPNTTSKRMDVLFVRWFGEDEHHRGGHKRRRLHRIGFLPDTHDDAFGFLDPADVMRASHLIPAFAHGRTDEYLAGETMARPDGKEDDWAYYYVNQYVK